MNLSTIIYIIIATIVSFLLGYEFRFTEATRMYGIALFNKLNQVSNENIIPGSLQLHGRESKSGFQDAITPPWSNFIGYSAHLFTIGTLGYGFYKYGWKYGLIILVGFFICTLLWRILVLPSADSDHFYRIIVGSMANRYADYVKTGDVVRAQAMADLLSGMGIDVPDSKTKNGLS